MYTIRVISRDSSRHFTYIRTSIPAFYSHVYENPPLRRSSCFCGRNIASSSNSNRMKVGILWSNDIKKNSLSLSSPSEVHTNVQKRRSRSDVPTPSGHRTRDARLNGRIMQYVCAPVLSEWRCILHPCACREIVEGSQLRDFSSKIVVNGFSSTKAIPFVCGTIEIEIFLTRARIFCNFKAPVSACI